MRVAIGGLQSHDYLFCALPYRYKFITARIPYERRNMPPFKIMICIMIFKYRKTGRIGTFWIGANGATRLAPSSVG